MSTEIPEREQLLNQIHNAAWGKSWPTTTCVVHRRDVFPDETDNGNDIDANNDNDNNDDDAFDHIPAKATFACLANADLLHHAFNIPGIKFSTIVIRKEYELLRELLENEKGSCVVTGQSGTGMTMFLLYVLLYRLQRSLPTAVQFSAHEYVVFEAGGVTVSTTAEMGVDHRRNLPPGCWCLSDGNYDVMLPCSQFGQSGLRTFLMTPPGPEYRRWARQACAKTFVTALPRAVEVAAIAKVHGWNVSNAVSIMQKWGPCTRMVLAILNDPHHEHEPILEGDAMTAALLISINPSKTCQSYPTQAPLSSQVSSLLFIQPIRRKDKPQYGDSRLIIPTMYLSKIFDAYCQNLSTEDKMNLYEDFSLHFIRKGTAGWPLEKKMHLQMATGKKFFEIFNGSTRSQMNSTSQVLIGTASALRAAAREKLSSFYWLPTAVDLPGIDGVLFNGNNVYAMQATVTDTHDGLRNGLKKIWELIGEDVARLFTWHLVFVTDNKPLADKHVSDLGTELHDVALGRTPIRVLVWGCVLNNDPAVRSGVGDWLFHSVVTAFKLVDWRGLQKNHLW